MIIFLIQKTRAKSNYSESCFMPQKVARKMAQKRLFVQKATGVNKYCDKYQNVL